MTAVENEKSTVTVTLNGVEIEANPGELLMMPPSVTAPTSRGSATTRA